MMKKLELAIIGMISLVFIAGCESEDKVLKCNKITEDSSGFKIEETYSYDFSGNNIKEFEVTTVSTPTKEELEEFLSAFSKSIDDSFKELKDKSGIRYSSKINDRSHVLNIKVDYDQINLKEFRDVSTGIGDIVNMDQKNISLNETKKEMEQEDYTCIVK